MQWLNFIFKIKVLKIKNLQKGKLLKSDVFYWKNIGENKL